MIIRADARQIPLADNSVQCSVTSPPYWGLRDYGIAGQIGLEPTPAAYVATIVEVFREVWRVLKADGTVWLNLGDSYAHNGACGGGSPVDARKPEYGRIGYDSDHFGGRDEAKAAQVKARVPLGLKPKDLCGIPWRVAMALQADGWYLRSDIIWHKPNPMPESVTDRPTRSHEYLFLLTKRGDYYYDAAAIAESAVSDHPSANRFRGRHQPTHGNRGNSTFWTNVGGRRNRRDVWTINREAFSEAHFATFPQALVTPCVLAGTSAKGCCVECGAPWVRETEPTPEYAEVIANVRGAGKPSWYASAKTTGLLDNGNKHGKPNSGVRAEYITTGWRPGCPHKAPTEPCLVLDPFLGSGTVGEVSERLGRRWVGLELSVDYIRIGRNRTRQLGLRFTGASQVIIR